MENVKKYVFCLFIAYSVIIVFLLYNNEKNIITSFNFIDSEENISKINKLEKQYNKLIKNECTDSIKELIDGYRKTSYKNKIDIGELRNVYFYYVPFSVQYQHAKDNCNLSKTDEDEIGLKFSIVIKNINEIENYLNYTHEVRMEDVSLSIYNYDFLSIKYHAIKKLQLEIIEELIEVSEKGSDTDE